MERPQHVRPHQACLPHRPEPRRLTSSMRLPTAAPQSRGTPARCSHQTRPLVVVSATSGLTRAARRAGSQAARNTADASATVATA